VLNKFTQLVQTVRSDYIIILSCLEGYLLVCC